MNNKKNKIEIMKETKESFLFTQNNYKILLLSLCLLFVGFIIMIGGGGETDSEFNPAIFSFRRIILAPILILVSYIGMVIAIFYND